MPVLGAIRGCLVTSDYAVHHCNRQEQSWESRPVVARPSSWHVSRHCWYVQRARSIAVKVAPVAEEGELGAMARMCVCVLNSLITEKVQVTTKEQTRTQCQKRKIWPFSTLRRCKAIDIRKCFASL